MSHIQHLSASQSVYGAVLRFFDSTIRQWTGGGSGPLRKSGTKIFAIATLTLAIYAVDSASAQSRGRSAPAAPPGGYQSEAIDLNEGKTAAELFQSGCAVCHQSAAGLTKGRSAGELTSFLRQHYTVSIQHVQTLSAFLSGAGPGRGAPPATASTPARQSPAATSRRPPVEEDETPSLFRRRTPEPPRPTQDVARPEPAETPQAAPPRRKPVEKHDRPAARAAAPKPVTSPESAPSEPAPAPAAPAPAEPAQPAPAAPSAPAPAPAENKPAGPAIAL